MFCLNKLGCGVLVPFCLAGPRIRRIARFLQDVLIGGRAPGPPDQSSAPAATRTSFDDLWAAWRSLDAEAQQKSGRTWTQLHGGCAASPPDAPAASLADARLGPGAELVQEFLRLAGHRGSGIRLDAGLPLRAAVWPRAPLDAGFVDVARCFVALLPRSTTHRNYILDK